MGGQIHENGLRQKVKALQFDGHDSIKDQVISEKPLRGRLHIIIMDWAPVSYLIDTLPTYS